MHVGVVLFIVSLVVEVIVLDFVFFVSTHVIYVFCSEEGTSCLEHLNVSIIRFVSHFKGF